MSKEPIYKPSIIDNLYLFSIIIGFVCINLASANFLYIIAPVLISSVYLDWRSARVAEHTKVAFFLFSDLITVFNYIGIFIALTLLPHPILGYSSKIWLHWGLIFSIYILWNLIMMRMPNIEKNSFRFFLVFVLIEIPIAIFCFVIFFEAKYSFIYETFEYNILSYPRILLLVVSVFHASILIYWFVKTYMKDDIEKK